jgi:3-dehydroquinate synthetase
MGLRIALQFCHTFGHHIVVTALSEVEFVDAVSAGGSVEFLPAM